MKCPYERAARRAAALVTAPQTELGAELYVNMIFTVMGEFEREIRPDQLLFETLCLFSDFANTGKDYDVFRQSFLSDPNDIENSLLASMLNVLFKERYNVESDAKVCKLWAHEYSFHKIGADSISDREFQHFPRLVSDSEYGLLIEKYIQDTYAKSYENGDMSFTFAAASGHIQKDKGYKYSTYLPSFDGAFERIKEKPVLNSSTLLDIVGIYLMANLLKKYYKLFGQVLNIFLNKCTYTGIMDILVEFLTHPDKHYNYVFACIESLAELAKLVSYNELNMPDFNREDIIAGANMALQIPKLPDTAQKILTLAKVIA